MDKETIIKICNNEHDDTLILQTIADYCIEMGKNANKTCDFISKIQRNLLVIQYCFTIALKYYKKKYSVIEIIQDNKVIKTF